MNTAQIAALDILIRSGNVAAIQALWASLAPVALADAMGVGDEAVAAEREAAAHAAAAAAEPAPPAPPHGPEAPEVAMALPTVTGIAVKY